MGYAVLRDLLINGEEGLELLKDLRAFVVKRKEDVVDYTLRNFDVEELILVKPFGNRIFPSKVTAFLERLSDIDRVILVDPGDVVECVELPENIVIEDSIELPDEFSSSPVNNIPTIYVEGEGKIELEIPALWIVRVDVDVATPVSFVKEKLDKIRNFDNLVVVLTTYLLKEEYEALETLVKENGGFVIDYHDFLLEPEDDVEIEFMMKMPDRTGKFVGMKMLRGESL